MHLVQYPLRRGELFNLVAVFHSDRYEEGWNVFGDASELEARFRDVHPQVKTLLAKINATLLEMDKAGEINQIWAKWLGPNTEFKMVREDKVVPLKELKFTPLP